MTRPPARAALGVGGLLGGLDARTRSDLAPEHPVSSSLECHQQGRTGGVATRLYLDPGLGGIPSRECDERQRDGREALSAAGATRHPALHLQWLRAADRPGSLGQRAELG